MPPTALLVIDIQRAAFDGVHCPPIDRPDVLVGNARVLVDAARASGTPVVFVQHCEGKGEPFEEGSPHGEFHEQVSPLGGEIVVKKYASSAFENTDLAAKLLAVGANNLIICGLQSEFCVSNTSKAALGLGYGVSVASDGHSTWPSNERTSQSILEGVNTELESLGVVLGSTAHLAGAMRTRG